jgi:hypothetical protein
MNCRGRIVAGITKMVGGKNCTSDTMTVPAGELVSVAKEGDVSGMRARARLGAILVGIMVLTGALAGQRVEAQARPQAPPPPPARLTLLVLNEADVPVVGAEVYIERRGYTGMAVRSDSLGEVYAQLPVGAWALVVRRLGFTRANVELQIEPGENRYTVQIDHLVTLLPGMKVEEDVPVSRRLEDFEKRRALRMPNSVITRADIERVNSPVLSRLLRGVSGLRIADSVGSMIAVSTRGLKPSRVSSGVGFGLVPCVMRVTLDGVLLPALSNIDGIVPADVHGIEVYNGPARLPAELAGLRTDNWCGVIAIWTRDR